MNERSIRRKRTHARERETRQREYAEETNEHFALFAGKTKYADATQGADTKFAMQ